MGQIFDEFGFTPPPYTIDSIWNELCGISEVEVVGSTYGDTVTKMSKLFHYHLIRANLQYSLEFARRYTENMIQETKDE